MNLCLPSGVGQTGSASTVFIFQCEPLPRVSWRLWISREGAGSTELLGHTDPADVAIWGETHLSGRRRGAGGACDVFGGPDLEKECESREGPSASFLSPVCRRRMPGCSQLRPSRPRQGEGPGPSPVLNGALTLHNLTREAWLAPSAR